MGDPNDAAGVERSEKGADLGATGFVDRSERLVEQQGRGVDGEGAGEGDPLRLSARQPSRSKVGEGAGPDPLELDTRLVKGSAGASERIGDIVDHPQVGEETRFLERHRDRSLVRRNEDLGAMIEGHASSNFALALMLKDVSLATQLGANCGAPMLLHGIVRGMLQAGLYELGADANFDDMTMVVEKMSDMKFREE